MGGIEGDEKRDGIDIIVVANGFRKGTCFRVCGSSYHITVVEDMSKCKRGQRCDCGMWGNGGIECVRGR